MELTTNKQQLIPDVVQKLVSTQRMNTNKRLDIGLCVNNIEAMIYAENRVLVYGWGTKKFIEWQGLKEACHTIAQTILFRGRKNGIMLVGGVGNGKTTLMKAVQKTFLLLVDYEYLDYGQGLRVVSAKDIHNGESNDERFRTLCQEPFLGIDDLGAEPREEMVYGRVTTPVIDLLEYRYSRQLFTIVTSNLNSEQRKAKYGVRLDDRFREMFEKIVFKSESFR